MTSRNTVIHRISAQIGDDVRQRIQVADGVDVSDWNEWVLKGYLVNPSTGEVLAALTEADGTVVRIAAGVWDLWFTAEMLDIAAGQYEWFARREDTDEAWTAAKGPFELTGYDFSA